MKYIGTTTGNIVVFDENNTQLWSEKLYSCAISSIYSDLNFVISSSYDKTLVVTNRATNGILFRLKGHTARVNGFVLHNNTIVSVSSDKTVKIWSLKTGKCIKTITDHTRQVRDVDIFNDTLATCGFDGIKIYNMNTYTLQVI